MIQLNLSNKEELVKNFEKLNTIEDKWHFWLNEFDRAYSKRYDEENDFQDFLIVPDTPEETEELNLRIFKYFAKERVALYKDDFITGLTFEEKKKEFEQKLSEITNREAFVNGEIDRIRSIGYTLNNPVTIPQRGLFSRKAGISLLEETVRKHYIISFNDYYLNGITPDLKDQILETNQLIGLMEGYYNADYMLYLEAFKNKINKPANKVTNPAISRNQQLLVLYYLGILDTLREETTNVKVANFLSVFLDKSQQNIRQAISKWNQVKNNDQDLEIVMKLFADLGMEEIAGKINTDIESLRLKANQKKYKNL